MVEGIKPPPLVVAKGYEAGVVCLSVVSQERPVEVVEGEDEQGRPLLHSCVRTVHQASFKFSDRVAGTHPSVDLSISSLEPLKFAVGQRYTLRIA